MSKDKQKTIQIHTYYNSVVPDKTKGGTQKRDENDNLVFSKKDGKPIMKWASKKDENDKTVYSKNVWIVFKADSIVPDKLPIDKIAELADVAKKAGRTLVYEKAEYEIKSVTDEYLMKDGTAVVKAKYSPPTAEFRPEISWS